MQEAPWLAVPYPYSDLAREHNPIDRPGFLRITLEDLAGLCGLFHAAANHPECDAESVLHATRLLMTLAHSAVAQWRQLHGETGPRLS